MLKTAESVTRAHPDKICDQISDAILDACLLEDPNSRVAVEVMGGHGVITVTGEVTSQAEFDPVVIAKNVYQECGYDDDIIVHANVVQQSPEIGAGVDNEGAGDQGIMVGYATNETPELMPREVMLARALTKSMGHHDGKAQVTLRADGTIESFLTSLCDSGDMSDVTLGEYVRDTLSQYCPSGDTNSIWMRNPNGEWTIGGFAADTGLTGRKLAIDNYGPYIPLGGGCFSGKDATKVDRSAAYMARKIAVDLLTQKGADEVIVHLAYAIGVAEPTMAMAMIDGASEQVTDYDLRPRAIIEQLDLQKPQFYRTAQYGHFGNGFLWDLPS